MTNREKYKFDYFTIDNYSKILKLAKDEGYSFILYNDSYDENVKQILWRHDVEFSPEIALNMAIMEHDLNIKSTYFFQIHSMYYNTLDAHYSKIVRQIRSLGHEIGLHFDAHYFNIQEQASLNRYIDLDKTYFENIFGFQLRVFSFHNTNPFILSCEDFKYGDLINVYSSYFKTKYNYCADSTGYWRYEILDEVLRNPQVKHIQVLTHDAMWSDEVLSPRQRVRKSIQDNAEYVKKHYDEFFFTSPANNIDD